MADHRKIIHIDMDAFFASVEQRDFPELRGKPVAVGGSKKRGVVAAASYEARKYGVHSAMSSQIALRKCPHLIFAKARFEVYREVSHRIREIFSRYTDLIEPLSLDEAYLDVTENKRGIPSATLIAKEIKATIKQETGLTASAGISINKFLAKIASDMDKPDGLYLIAPEKAYDFVAGLEVEKFHGVGKVTAAKMNKLGIYTGGDLRNYEELELVKLFGKVGSHYYRISRAIDDRPVKPDRLRKSVGAENTFEEDIEEEAVLLEKITLTAHKVFERLDKAGTSGKTVTVKLKFFDFELHTRSKTLLHDVGSAAELQKVAAELLYQPHFPEKPLRLLGISVSNLRHLQQGGRQLTIDFDGEIVGKMRQKPHSPEGET